MTTKTVWDFAPRQRIESVSCVEAVGAYVVVELARDVQSMRDVYVLREINTRAHWRTHRGLRGHNGKPLMSWIPDAYGATIVLSKNSVECGFKRCEVEICF